MNQIAPISAVDPPLVVARGAFVLIHVDLPQPGEILRPGATLSGRGWIVAEEEIRDIAVYLDESFVCYGSYGLPRPEIAKRFPHYPQAEQSGFSFCARPRSETINSDHRAIVIAVRTASGRVTRKIIPLGIQSDVKSDPISSSETIGSSSDPWPIKIFVDRARIDGDCVLRLQGWIASLTAIVDVRIYLDDQELGTPELGKPRPDVARDQPIYPNAGNSGFELIQDVSRLRASRSVVRVTASCAGGIRRQLIVPVESASSQHLASDDQEGIHFCCDNFAIRSDGLVSVAGWAVAVAGLKAVAIVLDGESIGEAEIGLSRPDVGNRFPRLPSARSSGFRFMHRLRKEIRGERLLIVSVKTCEGGEKQVQLPIQVTQAGGELEVRHLLSQTDDIRFEIDNPRLDGDRAVEPLRGVLTLSGWAVAREGIAGVDVQIDELPSLPAYVGVRRQDVASNFPDIQEALFSGFALTVPHRVVGKSEHKIRVLVRAKSGQSAERTFQLTAEPPEENEAGSIRARVLQAEIDLRTTVLRQLAYNPRFEVLILVCEVSSKDSDLTRFTLETLYRQAYAGWRALVLLPSGSRKSRQFNKVVNDVGVADRVRVQNRTNFGTFNWTGNKDPAFLLVVTAGDLLGADALLEFALASGINRSADFIYSDERCYDFCTEARQPWRKPDWSPDLLLSMNYIGRIWCATRGLIERARLTPAELLERGEYHAVLRLTEQASSIEHVPLVLCERAEQRLDFSASEQLALEGAVQRQGLRAEVLAGRAAGSWRVKRSLGTSDLVSIIIPTCGARGLIEPAINSIRKLTAYPRIEIVCIDNTPVDGHGWTRWIQDNADQVIRISKSFNWSHFNNIASEVARGEFLLFLNDDIEVCEPHWLEALVEHAQRPEVGVVGPQLVYPDGKVQHAGMFLSGWTGRHAFRFAQSDEPGPFGQALVQRNVIAVTGACMLTRRSTFEALGRFDEAHSVINNDVDFCFRTWKSGLRVVYTPFASLVHHEVASRGKLDDVFNRDEFRHKWQRQVALGDPFFNPGLSPDVDAFVPDFEPIEILYPGHPLIARSRVRRILALKLDHIGDFVSALPVFRHLKRSFPSAELTVLAAKASLSIAALEPAVDRCIEFNFFHARSERGHSQLSDAELRDVQARLRSEQFDLALDLRMQTDTRHILRYCGAELLAGFDRGGLFPWLDIALEWEGDMRLVPKRAQITDKLLLLANAIDLACEQSDDLGLRSFSLEDARGQLLALPAVQNTPTEFFGRPLVAIHLGAGSAIKQWPLESFAALIELLVAEECVHAILVGGPDELDAAATVRGLVRPEAVLSLVGCVALQDLPAVLSACQLFVGNDSGPKHLAAALGVPTVGIHSGNVDANEWRPSGRHSVAVRRKVSCGPCYLTNPGDCHRNLACISSIRPRDVYQACRLLLRLRTNRSGGLDA